ncbi:hypothetical protein AB1Y20_017011 [Prymnesium parvum]|uniref:Uncharacterized protein n=1 Tax=Prymnesium parvum TaxID=97485 RepID=A0AB34I852_PRYPA
MVDVCLSSSLATLPAVARSTSHPPKLPGWCRRERPDLLNSEVQLVPPRFQYPRLGLTSTVFGSMHVSVGCRNTTERIGLDGLRWNNSQQTRADARFDVVSGTILCRMPSNGHREVSCDTVPGLQVAEYYRECDLEDMTSGGPQSAASLSEEMIQRYLAILAAYRGMLVPAHTVFFFYHLAVEHLDVRVFSNPALLHGLLGQRLLRPRPVPNRSSTVIHPDHILQSAGTVNMLVSDLSSQGEGFIEGTYHDYMVPSLDDHCAFPFSRFLGDEC